MVGLRLCLTDPHLIMYYVHVDVQNNGCNGKCKLAMVKLEQFLKAEIQCHQFYKNDKMIIILFIAVHLLFNLIQCVSEL